MAKQVLRYIVLTILYTNRPRDGRYTNVLNIPAADVKICQTLTNARKYAYQNVTHKGFNKDGRYMCIIIDNRNKALVGEVLNTVWDVRYWYPSNDGVYVSAGKYTLYKDGTIGKRLR